MKTLEPTAEAQEGGAQITSPQDGTEFWLWKNGDHFLAFRHLYPCFTPGGDPMVLGEPVGRAVFRRSFDRHCGGQGNAAAPALTAAPSAQAQPQETTVPVPQVVAWSGGPVPYRCVRLRLDDTPTEYEYVPAAQPQEPPRSAPLTDAQAIAIAAYYDVTSAMVRDIYNRAHGISTPEEQR